MAIFHTSVSVGFECTSRDTGCDGLVDHGEVVDECSAGSCLGIASNAAVVSNSRVGNWTSGYSSRSSAGSGRSDRRSRVAVILIGISEQRNVTSPRSIPLSISTTSLKQISAAREVAVDLGNLLSWNGWTTPALSVVLCTTEDRVGNTASSCAHGNGVAVVAVVLSL